MTGGSRPAPFHVEYPRALPSRRPDGFQPAAPRYGLRWTKPVAMIVSDYFAIQAAELPWRDQAAFFARAKAAFDHVDGPDAYELMRASNAGTTDAVVVAYWTDAVKHSRWCAASPLTRWFALEAPIDGPVGAWRETIVVPYERHETIYSEQRWPVGLARTRDAVVTPIVTNGYFGAARDRIPVSAIDPLESPIGDSGLEPLNQDCRGRRLRVDTPLNMITLRSGQYWVEADGEQLDDYLSDMRPRLMRGMRHLVENPRSTGTIALSILTHLDETGAEKRETSVYAHFVSMRQLENWTKEHETHLSIYGHAIAMNRRFGADRQFMSWHELFAVPAATFEYVNCQASTGLLPFCPAMEIVRPLMDPR